jgi:hypothetical protein
MGVCTTSCHSNPAFFNNNPNDPRIFPANDVNAARNFATARSVSGNPGASLFLQKPSGQTSHTGGTNWAVGSAQFTAASNWIIGGLAPAPLPAPLELLAGRLFARPAARAAAGSPAR